MSAGYVAAELTDLLPEALSRLDSVLAAAPKLHRAALLSNQSLGDWLNDKLLAKIGGADHPTFAVLRARTGVDLYVVAMDLASRQPVVFSPDLTPDVSCKERRFPWIHHGAEVPGLHGASRLVLGVALRSSLGEVPDGGLAPSN